MWAWLLCCCCLVLVCFFSFLPRIGYICYAHPSAGVWVQQPCVFASDPGFQWQDAVCQLPTSPPSHGQDFPVQPGAGRRRQSCLFSWYKQSCCQGTGQQKQVTELGGGSFSLRGGQHSSHEDIMVLHTWSIHPHKSTPVPDVLNEAAPLSREGTHCYSLFNCLKAHFEEP